MSALPVIAPAFPVGPFHTFIVDPPHHFAMRSPRGERKSPSRHYATMTLAEMLALPVEPLAAEDAAMIIWGTQAQLPDAFKLMSGWGFSFKSSGSWAKQSKTGAGWAFGTGYWLRSASEPYLFGTRGKPKSAVKNIRNLIVAPVREHSRKPDQLHEDLERMFPNGRRIELFARGEPRPNWTQWGLEAQQPVEAAP